MLWFLFCVALLLGGYFIYGTIVEKVFGLKPERSTPAFSKGDGVGYNALWKAEKTTKIGTVSIGYADGYPRHAQNGTPVFINGKQSQILGRVSMDMLMVDLSMFEQQNCIGFDVELWGDNISVNKVAKLSETISYALFCGLTRRVSKSYIK